MRQILKLVPFVAPTDAVKCNLLSASVTSHVVYKALPGIDWSGFAASCTLGGLAKKRGGNRVPAADDAKRCSVPSARPCQASIGVGLRQVVLWVDWRRSGVGTGYPLRMRRSGAASPGRSTDWWRQESRSRRLWVDWRRSGAGTEYRLRTMRSDAASPRRQHGLVAARRAADGARNQACRRVEVTFG